METTPYALSIKNLVEMMRDASARTFDEDLRYYRETDAVLYGKIHQLYVIAEPHGWSNDLSEEDSRALSRANEELGKAFNYLAARVFPETHP